MQSFAKLLQNLKLSGCFGQRLNVFLLEEAIYLRMSIQLKLLNQC